MKEDSVHRALNPEKDATNMDAIDPVQIAAYYTGGDTVKAQQMVSGEYHDLYVFKLRIATVDTYAACIIFYNHIFNRIFDLSGVISRSYDVEDISISEPWKNFETKLMACLKKGEHDKGQLVTFLHRIQEHFTPQFGMNILGIITLNDNAQLRDHFQKYIISNLHLDFLRFNIDFEEISSLQMELESSSTVKLSAEQILNETVDSIEDDSDQDELALEDIKDADAGIDENTIKDVFNGELILAPTHGMHVSGLVCKDKIKVRLTDTSKKAIMVAKAFNAFKDQKMGPIIGTVVSFRRKMDKGYKIFVEIAEGLYVRIDEDQDNIKVEFVSPSPDRDQKLQAGISDYVDRHVKIIEKEKRKQDKKKSKDNANNKGTETKTSESMSSTISRGFIFFIFFALLTIIAIIYVLFT